jgi:threonine/homoserine/homoserine lactone efflux protein
MMGGVPSWASLVTFAAVSFAIIVIPGPSVMFVVSRAVAHGRRAAVVTVAGNAAGFYLQVLLVAVGLGAIVERSVAVYTAVKLIGAAYLVWLGLSAIRHRQPPTTEVGPGPVLSDRSTFRAGFMVGAANPKTIVFFAAILPQYLARDGWPAPAQMAVLGLVFAAIALVSDGAWALLAGTARDWFARSPDRIARLGVAGGAAIVGLGVHLAITGRKT